MPNPNSSGTGFLDVSSWMQMFGEEAAWEFMDDDGTLLVKVGDQVREGQTLMIIEAMKVMNPLPSPRAGIVKAILVNDGDPVEFGEPLLVIE